MSAETEGVLLPKLNEWLPSESLTRNIATSKMDNARNKDARNQSRKGGKLYKENTSFEILKTLNDIRDNHSRPHIHPKVKPIRHATTKGSTARTPRLQEKYSDDTRNNNNHKSPRLQSTRDIKLTTTSTALIGSPQNTYERLKVWGMGLNTTSKNPPTTSKPPKQQRSKQQRSMSSKEIISPLLNSLYSENTHSQQRKNKTTLLSTLNSSEKLPPPQLTSSKTEPNIIPSKSKQKDLNNNKSNGKDNRTVKIVTITEYLKVENARYESEEKRVKKILFENWLRNLRAQSFTQQHVIPIVATEETVEDVSSSSHPDDKSNKS